MPKIAGEDHDPDAILEATPDFIRTWDAESLQAYIDRAGPLRVLADRGRDGVANPHADAES